MTSNTKKELKISRGINIPLKAINSFFIRVYKAL